MQEFGQDELSTTSSMLRVKPLKRPNIKNSSPKMFYTPDEIAQNESIIQITFTNSNIIKLFSREFYKPTDIRIIQHLLTYKKVILTDCEYKFVYVQEGQEDLFLEMYIGIKPEEQKIKKYI